MLFNNKLEEYLFNFEEFLIVYKINKCFQIFKSQVFFSIDKTNLFFI